MKKKPVIIVAILVSAIVLFTNLFMTVNDADRDVMLYNFTKVTQGFNSFMSVEQTITDVQHFQDTSTNLGSAATGTSNPTIPGITNANSDGTMLTAITTMADWYVNHVPTYQKKQQRNSDGSNKASANALSNPAPVASSNGSRNFYVCSLVNMDVGDDCSSFAGAVVSFCTNGALSLSPTSDSFAPSGNYGAKLAANGFQCYETKNLTLADIQPGDMLVSIGTGNYYGHIHFALSGIDSDSKYTNFGWGSVQNQTSKHYKLEQKNDGCFYDSSNHRYVYLWRKVQ